MKILIVSPRFPYEQGKADSMTVFHLINFLSRRNHQVILATFYNRERFPESERERIRNLCIETSVIPLKKWKIGFRLLGNTFKKQPYQVAYYQSAEMQKCVDELILKHQPDVLYAHLIRSAEYIKGKGPAPKVLGMQIAQTLNYKRLIQHDKDFIRKAFYTSEYHRVFRYEPKIIGQFDRVLLISPHDSNAIFLPQEEEKIFYNPHGIDVAYFSENLKRERKDNIIVMNGDFGVPTNIDAALFFYREVYPLIKAKKKNVELWLVGRNPASPIRKLQEDPSVLVTGKVPDIRPYLQEATLGIAPLRAAAGLQNKILASLASQLPMVATPIANEGIAAPENKVILIGKDKFEFAEKVIALLENKKIRDQIGKNALRFMQMAWTWDYHFEKLEEMLLNLISDNAAEITNYYPFTEAHFKEIALPE